MTTLPSLKVLQDNRDALLLAEVAAWLHMLGKFSDEFLNGVYDVDKNLPGELQSNYPNLCSLLKEAWTGPIWAQMPVTEFEADQISIFDLIQRHADPEAPKGFLKLMWDAHGRDSGIEKGALNRFAPKQTGTVYPSTAVGIETGPISALRDRQHNLYQFLETQLDLLRAQNARVNWGDFRQLFITRLEEDFRTTVAETRRPLNDVTLFDQTMASVAFFKASLAQNLLLGWRNPTTRKQEEKYRWRILRVGFDGFTYWGQSARMNDLLARKAIIDLALDDARTLLEETYPLGMEIYRDENGSLFIVPDIEELLDYLGEEKTLLEQLQAIAQRGFGAEAQFELSLSEATRNTLSFGCLATHALWPPTPFLDDVYLWWSDVTDREICPVCQLRPQGPSAKGLERKVCDVCEQRRSERAKEWGETLNTTIWLDEVADLNGRVALVVGQFDLEPWLTGEALNTVLAFDSSTRLLTDERRNNKTYQFDYSKLLEEITDALSPKKANQTFGRWAPLLNDLLLADQRGGFGKFSEIYQLYVAETDLEHSTSEAWRFALSLMRQQPAFARLRRVWETTSDFWKIVSEKAKLQLTQGNSRLIIHSNTIWQIGLGPGHTYELDLGATTLAVMHQNGYLITADNLSRIARLLGAKKEIYEDSNEAVNFVKTYLLNSETQWALSEPGDYGKAKKQESEIHIDDILIEGTPYAPMIPILAEPRSFMALVPAAEALEIADKIRDEYQKQFRKVQNRLPLFLGIVFFPRKLPLMAVMDAARRMLNSKFVHDEWRIAGTPQNDGKMVTLCLEQNGQSITLQISIVMGDGTTEDVWYPYFELVGTPAPHHTYRFERAGVWWVHVKTLQAGETVRVTPSRFAYLFLESTAQRFRFDPKRDVLLLDELPRLTAMWQRLKESGITMTGLRNVQALLESKGAAWGRDSEEFERLTCTTLQQAGLFERKDKDGSPLLDVITPQDVTSERFAHCLELYLHILKQKIS